MKKNNDFIWDILLPQLLLHVKIKKTETQYA
jgi:hypothetical protein